MRIQQLIFLLVCIPIRLFLAYIARIIPNNYLPMMGFVFLIPAIGFLYFYFSGTRKTGIETFGKPIWWNSLRPVHSILYLTFVYFALNKYREAWYFLFADAIIGLIASIVFYVFFAKAAI